LAVPLVSPTFKLIRFDVELNQSCPGKGAVGAVPKAKFSINLTKF
jgi:hypothetical protein